LGTTSPLKCEKILEIEILGFSPKLFNEIMRSKQMSDEWRRNTLVSIFKNTEDTQNYAI